MTVLERFLAYVSYPTMSDEGSETTPSTERQWALARRLVDDLHAVGVENACVDMYGYVYASIEKTVEGAPSIGLIAHMDTAREMPDAPIRPRVVQYEGGDIVLSPEVTMAAAEHPELAAYCGQRLVVTDGHTLLGGDDKAGIAEIVEAVARILHEGIPHGRISLCFTPDEEIGRGADHFDLARFGCEFAYTVDGGAVGELEWENFNAARAKVAVRGVPIHPGAAKGRMTNAARIAAEFDSLLPREEIPECTEGYEGFHHLLSIEGSTEAAALDYLIRDHDDGEFARKKQDFLRLAAALNARYGEGTVTVEITDSYYNMRRVLEASPAALQRARRAMAALGIPCTEKPIRGGTDGARLSFLGLPCPNLGTGTENMHSAFEFVSVEGMETAVSLLVELVRA